MHSIPHRIGPMKEVCGFCGALYYAEEKMNGIHPYTRCCGGGKMANFPLPWKTFPKLLQDLYTGAHPHSKSFRNHIRAYNNLMAFGSIQSSLWEGAQKGGPFVYRVSGAMYRRVASTDFVGKLGNGQKCFGQLYFIDTCEATNHRSTGVGSYGLQIDLMSDLDVMLREINAIARSYKQMREVCDHLQKKKKGTLPVQDVHMVFETDGIPNPGLYKNNLYAKPTCTEIAAIIVGGGNFEKHAITVQTNGDKLEYINPLNGMGDAFCYPMLFPGTQYFFLYTICIYIYIYI
jgi:hypothetical protein